MTVQRLLVAPSIDLHVEFFGDGDRRPFVLAHGLSATGRQWGPVARRLAAVGHRVCVVDQRGGGFSSKPDTGYDMPTVAADLASVVEQTGFDRPVVVGQSWGGNVAVQLAADRSDLVAGIGCVDGGTIDLQARFDTWDVCVAEMAPPRLVGMRFEDIEAFFRSAHPDWSDESITASLAFVDVDADGAVAPWMTFERHLLVLRGIFDQRPKDLYPTIRVPVLFIPAGDGESGMTKSADIDAAAAALSQSRVEWIDGDHDLHAQYPDRIAALLSAATDDFFVS